MTSRGRPCLLGGPTALAMKFQTRLLLGVATALLAVSVLAYGAVHLASERILRVVAEGAIASAAKVVTVMEQADVERLDATVTRIGADPATVDAFARRDRPLLAALALPVFDELRANHSVDQLNFLLPDRTVFLRAQRPDVFGDAPGRPVVLEAAHGGDVAVGRDLGRTGYSLRVVRPLQRGGHRVGFVEVGERTAAFLARVRAQTGDDFALLVEKRHLDRAAWTAYRASVGQRDGWDDLADAVVVEATYLEGRVLQGVSGRFASLPAQGVLLGQSESGGRSRATGIVPVWNASGERVGGLVVSHDTSELRSTMNGALKLLALGLAIVSLLALAGVAALSGTARDRKSVV